MHTLIISPSRSLAACARIEELLQARRGFGAPDFLLLDNAEADFQRHRPELIVVVLGREYAPQTFSLLRRLREAAPAQVYVVGPATDAKLILRAVQAGADLFLDQDELDVELDAALSRADPAQDRTAGQLIAVLSASGGCGASTVAVNLATVLARHRGRCNLIDLNTTKPDLAPLLDLKPQYTVTDLCRHEERLDRTLYEKLLTVHDSGVALLAGPRHYADARALSAGGVELALGLARESFADVVVDLKDCCHDEQMVVLELATRILLVARPDFVAIRNARRIIDHLTARGVPRERIEVVLNHVGLPNQIPAADAQIALGESPPHLLPHDPETAGWSANTGIPAATKVPGSAFVQGIAGLVGLRAPAPAPPAWWARARSLYHERAVPWARSLRERFKRSPAALTPPPAADTKVLYESDFATEPARTDSRACRV